MPALDQCHHQIVRALEKAGWNVDDNPFVIPIIGVRRLFVDIQAEKTQRNGFQTIIVVEAKCFSDSRTELNDLYTAIGQYIVYRSLLIKRKAGMPIYLAVPVHAYEGIFQQLAMQVVQEIGIKMIVVDLEREVIKQWLE